MPTDCGTLINRTRRYIRDWPVQQVSLAASVSSAATALQVPDTTVFSINEPVEIDQETMLITALTDATHLAVIRGAFGSTAATHASAATILVKPGFYAVEIVDALNMGIQAMFPKVYKGVVDESITTTAETWEYSVPSMSSPSVVLPFVTEIEVKVAGSTPFVPTRAFEIKRGSTPKIRFRRPTPAGNTLRVVGFGPFPTLASASDTLDAQFPPRCEYLLSIYAAGSLLMSGEAGRVRSDRRMTDDREQSNRVGASAAIGQGLMNRFYTELGELAMPPLPRHVKTVI